jgi:hypothetical protein
MGLLDVLETIDISNAFWGGEDVLYSREDHLKFPILSLLLANHSLKKIATFFELCCRSSFSTA